MTVNRLFCSTFYHEHVLVKEPGSATSTPWHHDQSYYPVDGDDVCSLWIPVDPVSEERFITRFNTYQTILLLYF